MTEETKMYKIRLTLSSEYCLRVPITKEIHDRLYDAAQGRTHMDDAVDLALELMDRAVEVESSADFYDATFLGWENQEPMHEH